MKTKLFIVSALLCSAYAFSQNLVVGKRGYSEESESTIYSLLTLNSNTGEVLNSIDYVTDFSDNTNYLPDCLSFNPQTNEIVGICDTKIVFKNIVTNNETVLTIPEFYYQGAIVADNRLFLTNTDTIDEINPLNGNIIETHTLTSSLWGYNRNLTYSSTTKDIYGIDGDGHMMFKFNIITNQETAFVLPNESFYLDVVIAENRLFVNTQENTLLEIDTDNGSIINTYTFTTNLEYYDIRYMTFLADTQEICMIARGYSETGGIAKIVKYNINTNSESSFDLPEVINGDYGKYIVSTITEENLSLPEFQQENEAKVIKAYNLLGQEVPVETYNQIIILKYDNRETKKVYIKK